jgi:zinc transporter 1
MTEDFRKGTKVKHHDHYGYIYNSQLKCFDHQNNTFVDHHLDHHVDSKKKLLDDHEHDELKKVKHNNHYDYIVGNRLHYEHNGHCHDHGELEVIKSSEIEEMEALIMPMNLHTHWRFILMIILTGSFFFVELIVGIIIESLALQADAFHMLSDLMALIIAFYSVILSKRDATDKATFGWLRAEIIGALVNGVFLIASCFFIIIESIHKFMEFEELEETLGKEVDLLLIVGGIGLAINFIGVVIFLTDNSHTHSHSHSHGGHSQGHVHSHNHGENDENKKSLNVKALMMHMMGDIFGSISVMVSGLLIKFLDSIYKFLADPLVSLLIVCLILLNAIPLVKQCVHILLQKVPKHINTKEVKKKINKIEGIIGCHHLHVWQLNDARIIGTVHVMIEDDADFFKIFSSIQSIMHQHGVHNTTIQPENHGDENHIMCDRDACRGTECHRV